MAVYWCGLGRHDELNLYYGLGYRRHHLPGMLQLSVQVCLTAEAAGSNGSSPWALVK